MCSSFKDGNIAAGSIDQFEKLLMDESIDVNVLELESGFTPLHTLCRYYKEENLIDFVRLLIKKGASVNIKDCHGWTPLHLLNTREKAKLKDIVQLLKEECAEVNTDDTNGWTELVLWAQGLLDQSLIANHSCHSCRNQQVLSMWDVLDDDGQITCFLLLCSSCASKATAVSEPSITLTNEGASASQWSAINDDREEEAALPMDQSKLESSEDCLSTRGVVSGQSSPCSPTSSTPPFTDSMVRLYTVH